MVARNIPPQELPSYGQNLIHQIHDEDRHYINLDKAHHQVYYNLQPLAQ
jgi:hypothetical protein